MQYLIFIIFSQEIRLAFIYENTKYSCRFSSTKEKKKKKRQKFNDKKLVMDLNLYFELVIEVGMKLFQCRF